MRRLKILFVSLNNTIFADGSRILSASLRKQGHDVHFICLTQDGVNLYSEDVLGQFSALVGEKRPELVLYSFLSDNFLRASRVTERIYRDHPGVAQVWGGVHCTIAPEEAIKHCRIVCQGEGDEALPEFVEKFANGEDYTDVANFWFRDERGEVKSNPMRPLLLDLDRMPWPDYEIESHYILDEGRLQPMTMALLEKYHNNAPLGFPTYPVLSSRGCAFRCSFCYNATYKQIFAGQKSVRFRSLPDVVDELRSMKDRFPFFRSFFFSDDDFFLRSKKALEEFAVLSREKIPDLLFDAWWGSTATPASLSKDKLDLMYDIGFRVVAVGVQTGSEEFNKRIYDRDFPNKLFIEKMWMIDQHYRRKMVVTLDFIVDCPYETDADTIETVRLIEQLPSWVSLSVFTFVFYPGSPLYKRALEAGEITADPELYNAKSFQPFEHKGHGYIDHVLIAMGCANYIMPRWFKRFLISRPAVWVGSRLPQFVLDLWDWKPLYNRLWAYNQSRALGLYRPQTRWAKAWWKATNFFRGAEDALPATQADVMQERNDIDQWTKGSLTG
ncbi:MAG TPA: radical SAM protein [Planctomycetota bacterium]|nr:radical SAM protein [Planctomycetota bacterium]